MKNEKVYLPIIIAFSMFMISGVVVNAQKIELSPFIGYETGANISSSFGTLHVGDGMNFGGIINVGIGGGTYGEFSYSHLSSGLNIKSSGSYSPMSLAVDYFSMGVLQEIRKDATATPYGLLTMGIVNYRPTSSSDVTSENKMHVSIAGGVKIKATGRLGIRLQARLLMPIFYAGTYFLAGTGGGGANVPGGIHGVQGDFTAALIIKIK